MTTQESHKMDTQAEFNRLFALAPGDTNKAKVEFCAEACAVPMSTVYIWCCKSSRCASEGKLKILAREIERDRFFKAKSKQ